MSMGGKQEQKTSIDPSVLAMQKDNFGRAQTIAATPVTPYSGTLDLSASQGAARGLLDFNAPQITAASLDRGNIRDVNAGTVGAEQIAQFNNPFEATAVRSFLDDTDYARRKAISAGEGAATGNGAYGGSRHGVADSLTNSEFARAGASGAANMRLQGFNTALGAAQTEAARGLQAQLANQGVDVTVEQANAMLEQQTRQANQNASISSAGIRSGAAGLLGNLETTDYNAQLQEFLRQQNDPLVKQGLLNQSLGAIQAPSTTTSKTTPGMFDYLKMGTDAAASAAMFMSDERLKEDIQTLHTDEAGRRWVSWRWKGDDSGERHEGVIAQELALIEPERVLTVTEGPYAGYLAVNYEGLR